MSNPPQISEHRRILAEVGAYYSEKLRRSGPTPAGVDWNSRESQRLRFDQLLKVTQQDAAGDLSLLDYGCGYGALLAYLRERNFRWRYLGFDISEEMIAAARALHGGNPAASFTSHPEAVGRPDVAIASGIFNVKLAHEDADWIEYVHSTILHLDALSTQAFAFNMLSTYSDPEKRRPDLYYADPGAIFDFCKRRIAPQVALLHDYPLYEFTMIVRK
jgi:SAM-dependent methyltransferase